MSETNFVPDVIKSASDAVQANLPETAKQSDGAISTVVGFFNNVVLYPVKKANLTFKYKLEAFEDDLKKKVESIPSENLQVPPTMIAGPTLEALRYAYDEKELREMYENLLASAMDSRLVSQTHPSFVDAIKQMTPIEAKIIDCIVQNNFQFKCAKITFDINNTNQCYTNAMPDYFIGELYDFGDPFLISSSIINLDRLGLVSISVTGITGADYESLKNHPYVLKRKALFEGFGREFQIKISKHAVVLNNYGKQFARICLGRVI